MQTLEEPAAILLSPSSERQVDEHEPSHLVLPSTGLQLQLSPWECPSSSGRKNLEPPEVGHCDPDASEHLLPLGRGSCAALME